MKHNHLFSIGEIAKAVGITRKAILNYEIKGLIKPDIKDGSTGNRYYTIDTFTQIRTIRLFQDLGLSLDEIHDYFHHTANLQPMIKRLEKMRNEIDLALEKLRERTADPSNAVKEITVMPQTVYRRIYHVTSIADKTTVLRDTALEAMRKYGTDATRRMYFTEYYANAPQKMACCIAIPSDSKGEYVQQIPELKAISFFHHGAYEDIPEARKKLLSYAEENKITLSGTFRNLYLEGPPQHKDKSKYITQIMAIISQTEN